MILLSWMASQVQQCDYLVVLGRVLALAFGVDCHPIDYCEWEKDAAAYL